MEVHDTGIGIEDIRLLRARVEVADKDGERKFNLRLVALERKLSEDNKVLTVIASFDVTHLIAKPLFNFTCDLFARYRRYAEGGMPWEQFSTPMALAHMVPYLREFVSNMTSRMPIPTLMLPPVNTNKLFSGYEEAIKQATEAKQ